MVNTQAGMISNSTSSQASAIVAVLLADEPEPLAERPKDPEEPLPEITALTRGALQEV